MNSIKKKTIHFRADANTRIGLGHIIRCQSLAEMIKNNFIIQFHCRFIPKQLEQDLINGSIFVHKIESEQEFFDSLKLGDGVVVDGYSFEVEYHQKIVESGCKLVLIDDVYNRPLCAHLIINPAPGVSKHDYKILNDCPCSPVYALGPDYSLLRPPFLTTKPSLSKNRSEKTLFICFGGSDVKNFTKKVLEVAINFKQFKKITIITGSVNEYHHELKQMFSGYDHIHFHHAVDDTSMAGYLAEADIAVVPASGILFEALSMQTVVVSGMYVENQKNMYLGFKKMNAFVDAGEFKKQRLITAFKEAEFFKSDNVIDRKSPERYKALFKKLMS